MIINNLIIRVRDERLPEGVPVITYTKGPNEVGVAVPSKYVVASGERMLLQDPEKFLP